MTVAIRPVTLDDAYTVARLRQAMWDEMNHASSPRSYREALYTYWYGMLEAGRAVGWLAEAAGQAVGVAMLLLHDHPPRPTGAVRRGYVTNVYVAPDFRRQGVGRQLMEALIAYARAAGLRRLELRTSDMGRHLYEQLGFVPAEFLILRLDDAGRA